MKTIVFFLEEPSAREMLAGILPRILPDDRQIRYVIFQGKQDLEKNLKTKQQGRKFRNPDTLDNPADELFRLTNNKYDKVSGSRAIGPYLNLKSNTSKGFNVLLSGINNLIEA